MSIPQFHKIGIYRSSTDCGHVFASIEVANEAYLPAVVLYECPRCTAAHQFLFDKSYLITSPHFRKRLASQLDALNIQDRGVHI